MQSTVSTQSSGTRPSGFVILIQGVYMRRLISKDEQRYCEIRFEDLELLSSLETVFTGLQEEDLLQDAAKPVVAKVIQQCQDKSRRKEPNAHHLLLNLEEATTFFELLTQLDSLEQQATQDLE